MSEVIKKASFKPLPIELNFQALACQGQLGLPKLFEKQLETFFQNLLLGKYIIVSMLLEL